MKRDWHESSISFREPIVLLILPPKGVDYEIDDAWELTRADGDLSILTREGDADGDGESDLDESRADTDPFEATDRLEVELTLLDLDASANNVEITWNSSIRRVYDLSSSLQLDRAPTSVATDIRGAEVTTTAVLSEPLSTLNRKFWQITARRPLSP